MSPYVAVRLRIRQYPVLSSIVRVKCREQAFCVTEWVKIFCRLLWCVGSEVFSFDGRKASWDLRLLALRIWRLWNLILTPCSLLDMYQRVEKNLPTGLWKQQAPWELCLSADLHGVTSQKVVILVYRIYSWTYFFHMKFFLYGENMNSGVLGCDTVHTSLVGTIGFWRNLQPLWRSQWEEETIDFPLPISWHCHDNVCSWK